MTLHMELERRLAAFKKTEAAVVFQSGFTANAGTVAAILGRDDVIVSDELNHASIIDGARLSRAAIKVFPHRDADAARAILEDAAAAAPRTLLITDGVFSMDGDLGALPGALRRGRRVRLHHDGGRRARQRRVRDGTAAAPSITSACTAACDIQVGTLSKAHRRAGRLRRRARAR